LGLLFLAGHGVIRSDEHAYDWFRRSAAQGNLDAKRALDVVRKTK
jgi:TPR repeat protein